MTTLARDTAPKAEAVQLALLQPMLDVARARGITPPVYISANVPGGDEHNNVLKAKYAGRLRVDG